MTNYHSERAPYKIIHEGTRSIQNENYRQRQSYDALNKDHMGIKECDRDAELNNIEEHTNKIIVTSRDILDAIRCIRREGSD